LQRDKSESCRFLIYDIVGRLGGEEFGIVLVNCDIATAQERCEQLRLAFTTLTVPNGNDEMFTSASFGVTTTRLSGYELRLLLADADAALYQAKRSGRNRVVQYCQRQSEASPDPSTSGRPAIV
jgi:diguanylate cyclase (GGDEF)-like protein